MKPIAVTILGDAVTRRTAEISATVRLVAKEALEELERLRGQKFGTKEHRDTLVRICELRAEGCSLLLLLGPDRKLRETLAHWEAKRLALTGTER